MFIATTGLWLLPFSLWQTVLSVRVGANRVRAKRMLGDTVGAANPDSADPDPLYLATRAHANFLENVPLALIFAGVAELNGADRSILNYILGALFVLRVVHVEFGLRGANTDGPGRPLGYLGSQLVLTGLASWSVWLVKGAWGF